MKTGYFQNFIGLLILIFAPVLLLTFSLSCRSDHQENEVQIESSLTDFTVYGPYKIHKLPLLHGVKPSNPIQLELGPKNVLFATNQTGEVYSLHDTDMDGLEDTGRLYCNVKDYGLRSPVGFEFKGDTVYIGTSEQIRAFRDLDGDGVADTSWVFFDQIPESKHPYEWTSGMRFGPDGWLYCALTTDSWNAAPAADFNKYRGALLRISPDGKKVEKVAEGIRSVNALAFNRYGDLFFIDNEGGGNSTEELNRLVQGSFYGHNPGKYLRDSIMQPDYNLELEVAPSGIVFKSVHASASPEIDELYVSYYGPGERWEQGSISRVEITRANDGIYSFKELPIADIPKLSDITFGGDGSIYVAQHGKADYWYNAIYDDQGAFYKIVYDPKMENMTYPNKVKPKKTFSSVSVEAGKQLFAERACLGCHLVDGVTELLGPNLKDVGKRLTREQILEEIVSPSAIIKPSMGAVRIFKKDGQVLLGRIINADSETISLMLIGNQIVNIKRNEIVKTEDERKSLMYEGLLSGLSEEQINSLLDYLGSLGN